jgi:hypothetical protein
VRPTTGTIEVLGERPRDDAGQLGRVGFVAQDTPTYPWLSVADHLRLGAWLNPKWDEDLATRRISQVGLSEKQRAGKLFGVEIRPVKIPAGSPESTRTAGVPARGPGWCPGRSARCLC